MVSPKGGVGKSTIATLLGSLLGFLRPDRVVAVDMNPDWGSLGRRLVPRHPVFIDDLLADALQDGRPAATELDRALGRGPDGLTVAPAPTDPDPQASLYLAGRWLTREPADMFCFADIAKPGPKRKTMTSAFVTPRRTAGQLRAMLARIGQAASQITAYCDHHARCPGGAAL